MKMKSTCQSSHPKRGLIVWLLVSAGVLMRPVGAEEVPGLKQGSTNGFSVVRQAVLFLRSQGVLVDHEYCVQGTGSPSEALPGNEVMLREGNSPEAVLNKACERSPDYAWLHDARSGRYLVRPATNALSCTDVMPMSITNHTIASLFSDTIINRYMTDKGIFWLPPWTRQRTGQDIYVDFEFAGGTLADFLTETARNMGQGVCWDMKQWMSSMIRVPIGNQVVDRPQVGLDFTPVKGGSFAHLKPVLRTAEAGELEKLLSGASPRKRLSIAKELASRCINIGDMEKANGFFQIALDASGHEHERWELRLRMLEEGLGYPPANKKKMAVDVGQLERFIHDCHAEGPRHEALFRLLDIHLKAGEEEKARRLIESTSTNAVDSEWVHQAARIFYRRNPASPPLSLSSNAIPAKTASRPVIKTTYKIKKTADGKLEKQVATTEIPTDAGTNK